MVRPVCGSPPRGRGKVAGAACRDLLGGITPAWAGKRRCTAACNRLCWDHPRVGGEKIDSLPHRALYLGSPPRGRGKAGAGYADKGRPGITPAWAGKSQRCWAAHRPAEGSPPRGRGKDVTLKTSSEKPGITPAWAGKRRQTSGPCAARGDHPRVGGEKAATPPQ